MATATKEFQSRTETREVHVTEEVVTLTLSLKEAQVLAVILGSIGGSPEHSLRRYADRIENAVTDVVPALPSIAAYKDKGRGAIYFEDGFPNGFEQVL